MSLSSLPASAQQAQTLGNRAVTVLLAVDEACAGEKNNDYFKTIISEISADLQRDFALQPEIEKCITWKSHEQFSSLDAMFPYFFKTVLKKHADLVIGITCVKELEGEGGLSFYQEGCILVQLTDDSRFFKKLLKHEIYHIFGATHIDQESSLMDRFLRGDKLDRLNREIMLLNHDRDFKGVRFPLESHQLEKAAAIYREMADLNEKLLARGNLTSLEKQRSRRFLHDEKSLNPKLADQVRKMFLRLEDVYLALANLAEVFLEKGDLDQAFQYIQQAMALNAQLPGTHNILGKIHMERGEWEKAEERYKTAISLDPSYYQGYYNLGSLRCQRK